MIQIALLAGIFASLLFQAVPERKINILFIYADDQSTKTVGCYPEAPRWVRTPNIDRLAATGVRFERSYLGSWCMPSRATLLTGRLPHAIESMRMEGEYPGSTYDPAKTPFWPAVFRKNGYHTAQIGKWHTGTDAGFGRDWDYQVVWNRPKLPKNAGAYYTGQILSINGVEQKPEPEYSTDAYTRWAVDYIRGKTRDAAKPWYLWLCYGAVHGPTTPADRHKGSYRNETAPVPADIFGPRPGKPAYLDKTQAWTRGPDGAPVLIRKAAKKSNFDQQEAGLSLQDWIRQMNECARAVDDGVGRVMEALRESGQLENTLVIYTADQGYAMMGEHGLNSKLAPYDAAYASPLIASRPGTIPQGQVCAKPVNSADLVATFFATAGLAQPWTMHGRDLTPLLRDPVNAPWDHPTLMTHTGRHYGSDTNDLSRATNDEQAVPWWVMLRDGRFKYVRYLIPGEVEELYDLQADPEELKNLAVDPAHAERLERLRAKAVEELRRTEAGFVGALPAPSTAKR